MALPGMHDSVVLPCFHDCLAFLHRHFPPQSPPSHPLDLSLAVNSSPHPEIVPQTLCSSSQLLPLPGDLCPCLGYVWCGRDCFILIPFRLPQISCFTLSLKRFTSDSDNCPDVGIGPLPQFPHSPRTGQVLLTLLFSPLVPLSYQVLCGSMYSFHWSGTPVCSQLVLCMHFCV